ncbi:MAG: damage-inducible protein DinB [Acidobacteria bacterium]|nr:MAG: damage-inducible protein DinB [Acidobacteriota bacterium]
MRKALFVLLLFVLSVRPLHTQSAPEGLWQGYDGEWRHVSSQLIALAEATPEEKFAWRPAPVTGPKMPADLKEGMDKSVRSKAEVISWLKRSLEAVKQAHLAVTPKDLERKVHIMDRDATIDGMYLRIIVHANEHMGQLVAYARMTGVVPPWSGN